MCIASSPCVLDAWGVATSPPFPPFPCGLFWKDQPVNLSIYLVQNGGPGCAHAATSICQKEDEPSKSGPDARCGLEHRSTQENKNMAPSGDVVQGRAGMGWAGWGRGQVTWQTTNAGHRTPGRGRQPGTLGTRAFEAVIGRAPASARDEPSVEHVLLGQTTCVSRLVHPPHPYPGSVAGCALVASACRAADPRRNADTLDV